MTEQHQDSEWQRKVHSALAGVDDTAADPGFESMWRTAHRTAQSRRRNRRTAGIVFTVAVGLSGILLVQAPSSEPQKILPDTWASTTRLELATDFLLQDSNQRYWRESPRYLSQPEDIDFRWKDES